MRERGGCLVDLFNGISTPYCHLEYLDYYLHLYCFIHNISADASFSLLLVS